MPTAETVTRSDGWYVHLYEYSEFAKHPWHWYLYEPGKRAPRDAGMVASRDDALKSAGEARKRFAGLKTPPT